MRAICTCSTWTCVTRMSNPHSSYYCTHVLLICMCVYMCVFMHLQAAHRSRETLIEADKRPIPREQKAVQVEGILGLILPCNAVLHLAFPIHRFELVLSAFSVARLYLESSPNDRLSIQSSYFVGQLSS